jgi:uncharacterized protein YnzC (UPF0291/DUF896 family)
MLEKNEMERINELSRLKKARQLTEAEAAEQAELRAKYLEAFRCRFRQQLDSIEWVDPEDPRIKNDQFC